VRQRPSARAWQETVAARKRLPPSVRHDRSPRMGCGNAPERRLALRTHEPEPMQARLAGEPALARSYGQPYTGGQTDRLWSKPDRQDCHAPA
jgi:hypothetical protein